MDTHTYTINYGLGIKDDGYETIQDAKDAAVTNASYSQRSINIETDQGEGVATLPWYGVEPSGEDEVTVEFGNFGFYGAWQD